MSLKLERHMRRIVSEDKKRNQFLYLTKQAVAIWQMAKQNNIGDYRTVADYFEVEIPRLARLEWGDGALVEFRADLSVVIQDFRRALTIHHNPSQSDTDNEVVA